MHTDDPREPDVALPASSAMPLPAAPRPQRARWTLVVVASVAVQVLAAPVASALYVRVCGSADVLVCLRARDAADGRRLDDEGWFRHARRACDTYDAESCANVAQFIERATGDSGAAARVAALRRACGLKSPIACAHLGDLRERGLGVDQSDVVAVRLHRRACALGHLQGCVDARRIEARD